MVPAQFSVRASGEGVKHCLYAIRIDLKHSSAAIRAATRQIATYSRYSVEVSRTVVREISKAGSCPIAAATEAVEDGFSGWIQFEHHTASAAHVSAVRGAIKISAPVENQPALRVLSVGPLQ